MLMVDRVGFEPTTSAMPMPYPTGLDDRPMIFDSDLHINIFSLIMFLEPDSGNYEIQN